MAKALQCPACGTKRMVDTLGGVDSFPCGTCGKVLKVPPALADPDRAGARPAEAEPPARRRGPSRATPRPARDAGAPAAAPPPTAGPSTVVASSAAPGSVPPPPRRRGRPPGGHTPAPGTPRDLPARVAASAEARSTAPVSAVAAAGAPAAAEPARRMVSSASASAPAPAALPEADETPSPRVRSRTRRATGSAGAPDPLPVVVRILIWIVALPLGLALVGIPARKAGYLSSQKLLDVVIKHNLDRFVPLAVIVLLWALVTAIIVHLLAEGGRAWRHKRQAANEAAARPTIVSSSPGITPPPRRSGGRPNANGNGADQRRSRAASRGGS